MTANPTNYHFQNVQRCSSFHCLHITTNLTVLLCPTVLCTRSSKLLCRCGTPAIISSVIAWYIQSRTTRDGNQCIVHADNNDAYKSQIRVKVAERIFCVVLFIYLTNVVLNVEGPNALILNAWSVGIMEEKPFSLYS